MIVVANYKWEQMNNHFSIQSSSIRESEQFTDSQLKFSKILNNKFRTLFFYQLLNMLMKRENSYINKNKNFQNKKNGVYRLVDIPSSFFFVANFTTETF